MSGPKLATSYRDLGKANDLVTKNFLAKNSFAVTTEAKSGDVTFKSTVNGDVSKPVTAVVEPKYEWKQHNLVLEGKLSTANAFTAKGTYKNLFTPGFNLYLQGDRSVTLKAEELNVANSATGGFQFNNEHVHVTAEAKVPLPTQKVSITGSLSAKPVEQVSLGVKADYTTGDKPKVEGKLVGGSAQLEGALSVTYPTPVVGVGFWHSLCSDFQWATSVSVPTDLKKNPTLDIAGNYKFDNFTTVKGRLNATYDRAEADHVLRTAVSVQQKLNDNTTVTVGADVNLNHALNYGVGAKGAAVGDVSSCGIQVAFK